ncbi:MAG: hypothetical protein KDH20_08365 [Rhodocyclaceae bacterium]|nr:hypothetical protein [Rhodocyclaceae bacterium]
MRPMSPQARLAHHLQEGNRLLLRPAEMASSFGLLPALHRRHLPFTLHPVPEGPAFQPEPPPPGGYPTHLLWVWGRAPVSAGVPLDAAGSTACPPHLQPLVVPPGLTPTDGELYESDWPALLEWASSLTSCPEPESDFRHTVDMRNSPHPDRLPMVQIGAIQGHDSLRLLYRSSADVFQAHEALAPALRDDGRDWRAVPMLDDFPCPRLNLYLASPTPPRSGPRLGQSATPYRRLAQLMRSGDSVLFPDDIAKAAQSPMFRALGAANGGVSRTAQIVTRSMPGGMRVWLLDPDADAHADAQSARPLATETVVIRGHEIRIEEGVPVPPRRGGRYVPEPDAAEALEWDADGVLYWPLDERTLQRRTSSLLRRCKVPHRMGQMPDGRWYIVRVQPEPSTQGE